MPIPDWNHFMQQAKEQLTQELKVAPGQSFVRFLVEPAFAPHTYIQFVWTKNTVQWCCVQWDKNKDYELLTDPLKQLKFVTGSQSAVPSLSKNEGQTTISTLAPVVALLRSLCVRPVVENEHGFTLDGTYFTISIGIDNVRSVYSWHTLPRGWEDLETLAVLLKQTIDQLCKSTRS
jgi:hypothetical protein